MIRVLHLILALALGGCASDARRLERLQQDHAVLRQASTCCTSLASLPFAPLAIDQTAKAEIGATSPAYEFPSGKSYFLAFSLPPNVAGLALQVRSRFAGGVGAIADSHLFYPIVLFLNDEHEPLVLERNLPFSYREFWFDRAAIEADVPLGKEVFTQARYMIVFTDPRLFGRGVPVPSGGGVMAVPTGSALLLVPESRRTNLIPVGVTGTVEVLLYRMERPSGG